MSSTVFRCPKLVLWTAFWALIPILALPVAPAWSAGQRTVMLINSYHTGSAWVASYTKTLRAGLPADVRLESFDMDTKRLPASMYKERADQAFEAVLRVKPDIVITADDNALKWLGERLTSQGFPVVYLGINNNPRNYLGHIHSATGVLERPLLRRSLAYLRELFGDEVHRCLILFDSGWTSEVLRKTEFGDKTSLRLGEIRVDMRMIGTWSDWRQAVENARSEGYDALVLAAYHTLLDQEGQLVEASRVVRWTAAHSDLPPFALWDIHIGPGLAVGGYVISAEPQGGAAAALVTRILAGENPRDITPQTPSRGQLVLSRSGLAQWGIKPSPKILKETLLVP